MRVVSFVFLLFSAKAYAGELYSSYSVSSYADGKEFRIELSAAQLQNTPAWPLDAAQPPLPPRKAQELAREQITQLVRDGKDWPLEGICLADMGDGGRGASYGSPDLGGKDRCRAELMTQWSRNC